MTDTQKQIYRDMADQDRMRFDKEIKEIKDGTWDEENIANPQ